MSRFAAPRAAVAAASVAAGAAYAQGASSQAHPPVRLDIGTCVGAPEHEVRRIVGVELGALLAGASSPATETTLVRVGCEGKLTTLRVEDPVSGKSLERMVDLSEVDRSARARLLGLAAAELVSASWVELEANPRPDVAPVGARASPETTRAARASVQARLPLRLPLRMTAIGSRRWFLARGGALWGGGLRASEDSFPAIGWSADVLVEHGTIAASLGTVAIDTVTVGGALLLHHEWSIVSMRSGLGLRGGVATMHGEPYARHLAEGKSVAAPWVWPMLVVGVSVAPARPLVVELGAEGGYVVLPMGGRVGGTREVLLDGAWVSAQLGVGMFL
jgi:hypothetical protein